jgi:hypothetical protein
LTHLFGFSQVDKACSSTFSRDRLYPRI